MAINFITWLWGSKYGASDVNRLAYGIRKYADHGLVVFTDRTISGLPSHVEQRLIPDMDRDLIDRGCFVRLRLFDPVWQRANNFSGQIVQLDLDCILCNDIKPLFDRPESFLILQGVNAVNPCPFNCSVMMLRAGNHANVWLRFNLHDVAHIPHHGFPDDQGWIHHMLPDACGWVGGSSSGIYAFQKPGWPVGFALPKDARIVAFIGKRKPKMYMSLPWVQKYWIAA